jgi:RNA polymerase sigma-70 factor (ECF subfamily)
VRRAIDTLPEDQRLALLLFRFEGLSYEEVASAMGRTVSSVTSLLSRAREQLRQRLGEWARPDAEQPRKELAPGRFNQLRKVEP